MISSNVDGFNISENAKSFIFFMPFLLAVKKSTALFFKLRLLYLSATQRIFKTLSEF